MPMIEYECPSCSYSFELYESMENKEKGGSCPRCGGKEINRKGQSQKWNDRNWLNYLQKNRCGLSFG